MKQKLLMGLLGLMLLGLAATPLQADFIQCPPCNGTDNADVINGSPEADFVSAMGGNDIVFGADGNDDSLNGQDGNDVLFGGNGSDFLFGGDNNDILLPGPDGAPNFAQIANGDDGNDITNVLVGEITGCLHIRGGAGNDVANLVGFGPYSAEKPFGQPGFTLGWILVTDPVTGGVIIIDVNADNDSGVEVVNGLISPDVTILVGAAPEACDSIVGG